MLMEHQYSSICPCALILDSLVVSEGVRVIEHDRPLHGEEGETSVSCV